MLFIQRNSKQNYKRMTNNSIYNISKSNFHLFPFRNLIVFIILSIFFSISCTKREKEINPQFLELGYIEFNSNPEVCESSKCYNFTSTSNLVQEPKTGIIRIDEPSTSLKGTIVMYSGGLGTFYYSGFPPGKAIIDEALQDGYRVIQVKWNEGWFLGSKGQQEGFRKLAVHPATITKYISNHLAVKDKPLILFGSSGGAAQIAYMLSFYGTDKLTEKAIIFSGFWMGRLDIGCFDDNPLTKHLQYSQRAKSAIDISLGYSRDEKGPCELGDTAFAEIYKNNSISYGGNYYYPDTEVYLLYGGNDQVGALNQGLTYYEQVIKANSPMVHMQIVEGVGHGMLNDSLGYEVIRKSLFSKFMNSELPSINK